MVKEYDALPSVERGALLRREGLYASHISKWRSNPVKRKDKDPQTDEVEALNAKVASLEKKLETTGKLLELQKNCRCPRSESAGAK